MYPLHWEEVALNMKQTTLKGMFRIIVKVALAMMVILLVSAALLWFFLPKDRVKTIITQELSSRFNQDITMSEFSIGFYPDLEFIARNMQIVDPTTSQEILSARRCGLT